MPLFKTPSKLVVAVDFGETNSSVSYALLPRGIHPERPHLAVRTVRAYPYEISMQRGTSMSLEVPTLMRYPNDWVFRPLDELRSEPPGTIRPGNDRVQWGFQVQHHMAKVMSHSDNTHSLLYGFKNLMNQSENHEIQNPQLVETLLRLSKNGPYSRQISLHKMVLLVTIDYLTNLLSHAKSEITESTIITSTELVICVPVIWRQSALRDMQTCIAIAAKRVNFPGVDFGYDCVTRVFMITEPEAAATWLLSGLSIIEEGDVFTILDAGGGGVTLEGHIRKLAVHDFEYLVKPGWVVSQKSKDLEFEVFGLRSDPGSRNQARDDQPPCPNRLTIQAERLNSIYRHVCEEVSMLVTKQLQATAQRGLIPDHVVLMGGFGESKPLRAHLRKALASFNDAHDSDTALYVPDERERLTTIDAVSSGGVLRALNKLYGPTRIAGCSYGIRYDEPFELPKHAGQPSIEGFEMKQELFGQDIPPSFQTSASRCQMFPFWNDDGTIKEGPFICQEEIWVSDDTYLDHHIYLHELITKGAQKVGVLRTDVAHLLRRPLLFAKGGVQDPSDNRPMDLYWKVPYELVLTIDGLNMKCVQLFNGHQIGELKVGIAPGFTPGAN
ncbi:Hsp70 chaperone protein [Fusarium tjaetaba]|uniref:Hsp70 chaperone protein n=1 Tax=Fusarium tjaetaba TaxID=1567544 RepID=A0A8H5VHB8_9HYPO|nr:Hsp70 chaperone protein [Fusarium tjaetaba]KAF5622145.1 Hsp70 chaperone protein [Fusarium tjaetaba]